MSLFSTLRTTAVLLLAPLLASSAQVHPEWTATIAPFRIADNLYYVGSRDLASYLITTPAGNILINANLESSPPQIKASVERLGYRWTDTKLLLLAQAHFDHAAGAAQIRKETGAKLEVMEGDANVVSSGGEDDFLAASGSLPTYPPAKVDEVLHDGAIITLGGFTLTAHRTAGHTRGCTTWTMKVHMQQDLPDRYRDVVIVGGYTLWSDFQVVPTKTHPVSYPGIAEDFRHTFALLANLHCDIFLGDHASHFGMLEKLARLSKEGESVWIDPVGYQRTVENARVAFEKFYATQENSSAVR